MRKLVSEFACKAITASLLISLCQPMTAYAEEGLRMEQTDAVSDDTLSTNGTLIGDAISIEVPSELLLVAEEGAIPLGDFRLTYYCCERYRHICGNGTGTTASGRPVEAGRSIAVDPDVIPLGSRVWIDFGDGEGWHEYSADDVGSCVEGNHIDIAIETHREALHQTRVTGRVCFSPPPSENSPAK